MICRHWRALAKPGQAGNYIRHLTEETFPKLSGIPGFVRASILQRELPEGTEFLILTEWESLDAIRRFAGADPEVAVVPPAAQALMVEFDPRVRHFEIAKVHTR